MLRETESYCATCHVYWEEVWEQRYTALCSATFFKNESHLMNVQIIINEIVERIQRIDGVSAVVLGGSRASGTHTAESDVDLGIYYHPDHPMDLATMNRIASEFDDEHRENLLTPIGGW